MPEIAPDENAIPLDYEGPALLTYGCATHGAHINFDWFFNPLHAAMMGVPARIELDQMNPETARAFAADLISAAEAAEAEIARVSN